MKYAIIGFGGIGKCHFNNKEDLFKAHPDVELVALCDIDKDKFTTNTSTNLGEDNSTLDLSAYRLYNDLNEMLEKEELDFVVGAIPTFLHDTISAQVMKKGINMFCEKPMALSLEKAQTMLDNAKVNNVKLMIGQCVRYFPEYAMLKDIVDSKKYGNVVKAEFIRLSPTPLWSWNNWYMDPEKSGGAALDLHVHDVDFINYLFGKPKAVTSTATNHVSKHDAITTYYDYGDFAAVSTGDWGLPKTYPFTPAFLVKFEKAAIEMRNGKFTVYTDDEAKELEIPSGSGYALELIDFVNCIKENRESKINPPESTIVTLEIALAEKKSADLNKTITL